MTSLLPSWAPNLHPLVIHFPIVLLIAAALVDVVDTVFDRAPGLGGAATTLYVAGTGAAIATFLTGLQAGSTVFIPGMAFPVLNAHRNWAMATTIYFGVLTLLRLAARRGGPPRSRRPRLLLLAFGLAGVVLLQQTAERGARLVYQHGVGVIAAPGSR